MSDRRDIELAEVFAKIARSLVVDQDPQATLLRICSAALTTVGDCEHVGLSLIQGHAIRPGLGTDDIPHTIDVIQSDVQEGPCIDAIREHAVFRTGHLSLETRWPQFATRAHAETGVESILSFRLFAEEDTMGSLNLYSTRPDAFTDEDVAIGAVFAAHAAMAMISSRRERNLERKAESRNIIGIAKGILMAQRQVSDDEAFGLLVHAAQHLNIKLRKVAENVAYTGVLPDPTIRPQGTG